MAEQCVCGQPDGEAMGCSSQGVFPRLSGPICLVEHSHQGIIDATGPFTDSLLTQTHRSTLLRHPHNPTQLPLARDDGPPHPAASGGRVIYSFPGRGAHEYRERPIRLGAWKQNP